MKKIILLLVIASGSIHSWAQTETIKAVTSSMVNEQKTANTRDILTNLFQAGIDNLLGSEHKFTFNSTFYGIDSLFRKKSSSGGNYENTRSLKQNSFNIGITGDSVNNITKISGGFTFTLLNKKNSKFSETELTNLKHLVVATADFKKAIFNYIANKYPAKFNNADTLNELHKSWNNAALSNDFSTVNPVISEAMESSEVADALDTAFKINKILREQFKSVAAEYERKPLWTFSPTGTYDRVNKQGQFSFASNFTVGLTKDDSKKPWEIEIKGLFKIENDSSNKKTNYDSKPFSVSLGVNKVLVENEDKESKMEFKFFTQLDHQFGKVNAGAEKNLFTLNSTLRINVFRSLWLPLTIKYDPKNSNFLGHFSITANIGN